jgi:hypothetical protein
MDNAEFEVAAFVLGGADQVVVGPMAFDPGEREFARS